MEFEWDFEPDKIGYWSENKLEILQKYYSAYVIAFTNQPAIKRIYIDAFSGSGVHVSRDTGDLIKGSPQRALDVKPPFHEYHFIDMDDQKIGYLESMAACNENVHCYNDDCNDVLLNTIFPGITYKNYKRAICLLDPYGIHLNWDVVVTAGRQEVIEIFINFPIADINRNVLRHDTENVQQSQIDRMNAFWGDESWRDDAYTVEKTLFEPVNVKKPNMAIVAGYKKRLKEIAGFKFVVEPIPMKNTNNADVYYLFFATNNQTGYKIANDIFKKYR